MAKRKTTKRKSTKRRTAPRKMTQKERARYNSYWAIALCFLALLFLLAIFGVDAVVIGFLGNFAKGICGAGFYTLPVFLVAGAVSLFVCKGKPVKGRVICALLSPILIGCTVHSFTGAKEILGFAEMYKSGGVISGYIATLLNSWISPIAAIILFVILTVVIGLASFNITVVTVYEFIRDIVATIPRGVEYEEEETYEEEEEHEVVKMPKRRRPVIDVPLDGEEREVREVGAPFELPESTVKTPAEVLAEEMANAPIEPYHINEEGFADVEEPADDEPVEVEIPDEVFDTDEKETEGEQQAIYHYPPISLLKPPSKTVSGESQTELNARAKHLAEVIHSFGIEVHILNIVCGPSVTRYEVQLDAGVKFSRLTSLTDDIALALGASSVYIAPIPNKSAIGIEVPNKVVQTVTIQEVISSKEFSQNESRVAFAMGKDISGNCMIGDIAKLPHLLIAGTTGSGKSVCMNSIIISLLYRSTPEEVRLIMIDPKMVELGIYNGIPHLLVPVVTDPKKASGALQWAVLEMMKRYKLFADSSVRDMQSYNKMIEEKGEGEKLPQIVIVIDELADLMVVARKEVEDSIMRLTQMARAAGMHLIIATQRPSVDVITGVIKSNIPSRIAFAVASKVESNIILGSMGAEKLIGRGDMLFNPIGSTKPTRIQGCFISGSEVEAVVEFVKKSGVAEYSEEIIEQIERQAEQKESGGAPGEDGDMEADEMLDSAIDVVVESGQASVSMLQRRLKLGYSRAARIVDQMEERGIVGPFEGAKPRQVLVTKEQWQEIKMRRESL